MKTRVLCATFVLFVCGAAMAQSGTGLSFEVASIKPAAPQEMGRIRIGMSVDEGMLRYTNVSLRDVIRTAYKVKEFQIEGPDWLGGERFDIQAKFPAGATEEQVPEMLQALLSERFKLVLHRDTKEHAIYALVAAKDGAKLKPAEVQVRPASEPDDQKAPGGGSGRMGTSDVAKAAGPGGSGPRGTMMMMMDPTGMHLKAAAATLPGLAEALSRFTERPVVDATGIKGQYDFDLVFSPETMRGMRAMTGPMAHPGAESSDAASDQAPSVVDSVQKYGLKMESRKGPLEMLTIDHIEKTPTEN